MSEWADNYRPPKPLTEGQVEDAVRDGVCFALSVHREHMDSRQHASDAIFLYRLQCLQQGLNSLSIYLALCLIALLVIAWRVW